MGVLFFCEASLICLFYLLCEAMEFIELVYTPYQKRGKMLSDTRQMSPYVCLDYTDSMLRTNNCTGVLFSDLVCSHVSCFSSLTMFLFKGLSECFVFIGC